MPQFNYLEIHRAIATSAQGEKRIRTVWENRLKESLVQLQDDFESHPVTQEIDGGPSPANPNISQTLGGEGNLFSFLGFHDSDNPLAPIREIIANDVKIAVGVRRNYDRGSVKFRFSLRVPTTSIREASPMTWESGQSWTDAIERGTSGFSHYLWKKFIVASRSGYGIQSKYTVRDGEFKPRPYLTEIFNNFVNRMGAR